MDRNERGGTWDKGKGFDTFGQIFLSAGQFMRVGIEGLGQQVQRCVAAA